MLVERNVKFALQKLIKIRIKKIKIEKNLRKV